MCLYLAFNEYLILAASIQRYFAGARFYTMLGLALQPTIAQGHHAIVNLRKLPRYRASSGVCQLTIFLFDGRHK
jgi:hypothetical protein